ncbi:uncharacterized protein LOC119082801 [Bradysia coprophila]|uniref:uncharacterized protein LOC119082801 n=1 Tax=Bradysia coprophila TaxID=38358 RepID=UPI00187D7255|nr:uncharacterized protein LOC119082801 [Bradysia coprophila]
MDSIMKSVGGTYVALFTRVLVNVFTKKFLAALDEQGARKKMFDLRLTWHGLIIPVILRTLDVEINKIDPAWPIIESNKAEKPAVEDINPKAESPNVNKASVVIDPVVYVIDDSDSSDDEIVFVRDSSDESEALGYSSDSSETSCDSLGDSNDGTECLSDECNSHDSSYSSSEITSSSKTNSSEKVLSGRPIYREKTSSKVQVKKNLVTRNDYILVSQEELDHIFDEQNHKFKTFTYVSYFSKQMEKYVSCTLRSIGSRLCKSTFTCKFKCMQYQSCKRKYHLVCKRREKIDGLYAFRILFTKDKICHTKKIARQCRGIDRTTMKRRLAKSTVDECREYMLSRSNKQLLKKGNLQNVYSTAVLRKMRSEELRKSDLHEEAIAELGRFKTLQEEQDTNLGTKDQYIRGVGNSPFFVHTYSYEQLRFVRDLHKKNGLLGLFFDATGRMAQQPRDINKKTLYYAGTIPFKIQDCDQATIVPAFDALMSDHDIPAMKSLLSSYKDKLIEVTHTWPVFQFVVSDGNFAALHAICESFNNMDLISYINLIFDKMHSDDPSFDLVTQIKLCCAHLMKNQANLVAKLFSTADSVVIYNVKCMIAAMYDKNWTEICKYWKHLHVLFSSEFENKHTREALTAISSEISAGNDLNGEALDIVTEKFQHQKFKKSATLYEQSKFYIALKQIETPKLSNTKSKPTKKNPYFNPAFEEKFLKRYATLLPLWVSCTNIKRQSNSYVEGYFKIIKGRLDLKHTKLGRMPIKAKRLLTEIQSYTKAKLSEYWLKVPKSRATGRKIVCKKRKPTIKKVYKANRPTKIRESSPELEDRAVVESWNARPRRYVKSYFESLCKISTAKRAKATTVKLVSSIPRSARTKRKLTEMVQSVATLRGSLVKRNAMPPVRSNQASTSTIATRNKRKARSSSPAITNKKQTSHVQRKVTANEAPTIVTRQKRKVNLLT